MPEHKYWVFVARPMRRARLHIHSCIHCNDGKGQPNQEKGGKSQPTEWIPFDTLVEAENSPDYLNIREHKVCGTCNAGK